MHNAETGWTEADITINGVTLDLGQSMTLRVAVSSFLMQMSEPDALGDDESGRAIASGYTTKLRELIELLHRENR